MILLAAILLFMMSGFTLGGGLGGRIMVSIWSSVMLLAATYAVSEDKHRLFYFAIGVIILREGSEFIIKNAYLASFASLVNIVFFLLIVFHLVKQVARSKEVDLDVILESINGYLLVGLSGGVLLAAVYQLEEQAYAFAAGAPEGLSDFIYYGFITLTTIGYGDITPVAGLARFAAILVGISGQLYIAIIIAVLVGKYLARQNKP